MKTLQRKSELTFGISARGRRELAKHLKGGKLTRKEAMLAACYDCVCGYEDGKVDCRVMRCPLHPFMPFNSERKKSRGEDSPEN